MKYFKNLLENLQKEELDPITVVVDEVLEEIRAELKCPTEEELCGYVDGTLARVAPEKNRATENHLWGTLHTRPCIFCMKDAQELCEVLEGTTAEATLADVAGMANRVFTEENPCVPDILRFISFLRNGDRDIRVKAWELMQDLGNQRHVHWLQPLLTDRDSRVRGNTAILLGTIGSALHVRWLETLLHDENEDVKQHANNAIRILSRTPRIDDFPDTQKVPEVTIMVHTKSGKIACKIRKAQVYEPKLAADIYSQAKSAIIRPTAQRNGHFGVELEETAIYIPQSQDVGNTEPEKKENSGAKRQENVGFGAYSRAAGRIRVLTIPMGDAKLKVHDVDEQDFVEVIPDDCPTIGIRLSRDMTIMLNISQEDGLAAVICTPKNDGFVPIPGVEIAIVDENGDELHCTTGKFGWADLGPYALGCHNISIKSSKYSGNITLDLKEDGDV